MMRYMFMFWVDESAEATADEDAGMMIAVKSWVEDMTERGVRLSGSPLGSVSEARIVRVRDGELLVSDGPFAEIKEQIGGYGGGGGAEPAAAVELATDHPLARTPTGEEKP